MIRRFPAAAVLLFAACASQSPTGTLLLVGGGLEGDSTVYAALLQHAAAATTPGAPTRIVIATAATGPQDEEATDKSESIHAWQPNCEVAIVRRETDDGQTVAALDAATGAFFTGGDQERITARYRPEGRDTPPLAAMRRLLARGGMLGGGSAGDAMMGDVMFVGGGSARALAVPGTELPHGPQLAKGMGFLPWALTDSHFFERNRIGRLGAGLLAAETRLGLGIGEVAAVTIELAGGTLVGLTDEESLLVDAASARRDGTALRGFVARRIGRGDTIHLPARLAAPAPHVVPRPAGSPHGIAVVEPGQNRQLASWRLVRAASLAPMGVGTWELVLDGWRIVAWANGDGEIAFDLEHAETVADSR